MLASSHVQFGVRVTSHRLMYDVLGAVTRRLTRFGVECAGMLPVRVDRRRCSGEGSLELALDH